MKSLVLFVVLATSINLSFASVFGRTQSVAVRGTLFCGSKPATNVKVSLYDQDDGLDPDDQMATGFTNSLGEFHLSGSEKELTPIDPEIRIYHDCNHESTPCLREWIIQVPNLYITSGNEPKKTFKLGNVNLEVQLDDEDVSCLG